MKNLKMIAVIALTAQILSACTEVIELDLNSIDPEMVIEGYVDNAAGPYYVRISQSQDFNEPNSYPPVSSAMVTISDDEGTVDTLSEVSSGLYATTSKLQGKPGRTYSLFVKTTENAVFTASCTMPFPVALDTAYTSLLAAQGGENILPVVRFTDPGGQENYYNMTVKRDNWNLPGFYTVSDELRDGESITRPLRSSNLNIQPGDELIVELQAVDKQIYNYFYVLGQAAGTGISQSPTPSNPEGNIFGGALGYFSAHTTSKKMIIAQ